MYTGMDTVNSLYERLEVEDEWSVRYENGFKWWPCRMAQTVEVACESNKLAFMTGYYISVRTEICRVINLGPDVCKFLNRELMPCASLAGLVYNPDKGVIELCSWILVFEHYREWMERALWAAAALQVHEGETMVNFIGSAGGMGPAVSGHPKTGVRKEKSRGILSCLDWIASARGRPSPWQPRDMQEAADWSEPIFGTDTVTVSGRTLSADFPFINLPSTISMTPGISVHRMGNGLNLWQRFPLPETTEDREYCTSTPYTKKREAMALELNEPKILPCGAGHGFGSYFYADDILIYTSFIPDALYDPSMPFYFYASALERGFMMNKLAPRFSVDD